MTHAARAVWAVIGLLVATTWLSADEPAAKPQYAFDAIQIAAAAADEPSLGAMSLSAAVDYLEQGARAWGGARKCVSCHTNGTYMLMRPALSAQLGPPDEAVREFFVTALDGLSATEGETLQKGTRPAQIIYIAAGLAEWDAQVSGQLSVETDRALRLMFSVQQESGSWNALDCWPPYESDAWHLATVAAMGVAIAPDWLDRQTDAQVLAGVARLKHYLRNGTPPHDYGRVLLLWAATRMPDLLDDASKQELVDMISRHQRADGGWSIRTFAAPEAWGRGNRAERLRAEPDADNPASDGHQTGLALVVLRAADVPADDARIQRGVAWLLANQRASGRWWTRSLNTDNAHYITYSGTALPLLALAACNSLSEQAEP